MVSDLNTPQTILHLIGAGTRLSQDSEQGQQCAQGQGAALLGKCSLHELPAYTAAKDNPEIGMSRRPNWGPKDADYFATRHQAEMFVKGIPDKLVAS